MYCSVDGGEFGRPTNEELSMPSRTPHSLGLQLERFCEQPEDEGNSDELCKIKPVHCQGTENYNRHNIHHNLSYRAFVSDQKIIKKIPIFGWVCSV